jgi:hypothetical protein
MDGGRRSLAVAEQKGAQCEAGDLLRDEHKPVLAGGEEALRLDVLPIGAVLMMEGVGRDAVEPVEGIMLCFSMMSRVPWYQR